MTEKLQETQTDTANDLAYDPESEPDDDIPDMSTPFWVAKFAAAKVQRGRPLAAVKKAHVTLRLDPDVLASYRASGPGWQSRMNAALRKSIGLD